MGTKYYPVIDVIATGKNILRLRKAQGYSVADLQEFLGFEAPQAIYKWQSGKSLPSTDNLFALSVFFEVSIEDISRRWKKKPRRWPGNMTAPLLTMKCPMAECRRDIRSL